MSGDVALRTFGHRVALSVDWKIDVSDAAAADRGTAGQVSNVLDVFGAHHPRVVAGDVHEEAVEINVLLRMGFNQVVEMVAGDCQDRFAVELRVVEAIEQMN